MKRSSLLFVAVLAGLTAAVCAEEKAAEKAPAAQTQEAGKNFLSNGSFGELNDKGLVCRRPKGNEYTVSDDRWALEFFWEHRADTPEALVHAVLTNAQMWDRDLTEIAGFESAVVSGLKKIRSEGAEAAFKSVL